jgi:hypothetical protein
MAAACLGGFPAAISARMFWTNAFSVGDCLSGIGLFQFACFEDFSISGFLGFFLSVVDAK